MYSMIAGNLPSASGRTRSAASFVPSRVGIRTLRWTRTGYFAAMTGGESAGQARWVRTARPSSGRSRQRRLGLRLRLRLGRGLRARERVREGLGALVQQVLIFIVILLV